MKRPEVKIVIPDILKLQLVDDWENVTKNNQVGSSFVHLVSPERQRSTQLTNSS